MSSASDGSALSPGAGTLTRDAVTRAKAGDSEGLHYLYVRYADDVLRYVTGFIRDHHEAEDITQNVFAKLMRAIAKYEQREVLVLRHIVGLSPVEIAGTLDKTESSVHGLHHRGRRLLRASLIELDA